MNHNTGEDVVDVSVIRGILKDRDPFSHKGDYGHACLVAGSYGMMGAAVLAAGACLRSGVGKLTCFVPAIGYDIMQISVPEAMTRVCGKKTVKSLDSTDELTALGIGPGIGLHKSHVGLLEKLFSKYKNPVVCDADALNVLAQNKELLKKIPANSIITPHPKEFERLFGKTENDFEQAMLALEMAYKYNIYIVLKRHRTLIASPEKKTFYNPTGNPGMATAGSGDVLTGIITGLLAQGYNPQDAGISGVYLHGLAGDLAAASFTQEAMVASDIINNLG